MPSEKETSSKDVTATRLSEFVRTPLPSLSDNLAIKSVSVSAKGLLY